MTWRMKASSTLRILLAEDEEAMRTYLERALTNAGYEVVAVDRGTAAVPLLETERFDLLQRNRKEVAVVLRRIPIVVVQ